MSLAERLKSKRVERGFESAKDAAEAMGVPKATYTQYENGIREPGKKRLEMFADFYRTSVEWLMTGRPRIGAPQVLRPQLFRQGVYTAPLLGLVGAGAPIEAIESGDPELVDIPANMDGAIAFRVRGASCEPVFEDGDVVIALKETPGEGEFVNRFCIVETVEGNGYLKQVVEARPAPGGQGRAYTLRSPNADDLPLQNISSARPVVLRILGGTR